MISRLKAFLFKLSYNPHLRKIAKKIFVYFPSLKQKLITLRDNGYARPDAEVIYDSYLLEKIEKDVLDAKKEFSR